MNRHYLSPPAWAALHPLITTLICAAAPSFEGAVRIAEPVLET